MKMILAATTAVVLLATPALSQTSTPMTPPAASSATIMLAPEQRAKIKQYVVQQKVKPVTVSERVAVGATLPADVELIAVPSDWGPEVTRYRFIYSGDHVVLVDPSSRRVVQILD